MAMDFPDATRGVIPFQRRSGQKSNNNRAAGSVTSMGLVSNPSVMHNATARYRPIETFSA